MADSDLKKSDDQMLASYSDQTSGTGADQKCKYASEPVKKEECDIDDIEITEARPDDLEYEWKDGWFSRTEPKPKERKTSLKSNSFFEVVAGEDESEQQTKITAVMTPFASCGQPDYPDHVKIEVCEGAAEIPIASGHPNASEALTFPVYYQKTGISSFLGMPIPGTCKPRDYKILSKSCGWRNSGKPSPQAIQIRVYPRDQISFEFRTPPLFKKSYELERLSTTEKMEKAEKYLGINTPPNKETEKSSKTLWGKTTDTEDVTLEGTLVDDVKATVKFPTKTKEGKYLERKKFNIVIKKNGEILESKKQVEKFYDFIKKLEASIRGLQKLIKDFVPQVGFKFEWEIAFLSGVLGFTYGFKEHTDHRVYLGYYAFGDLQLFKGNLTISFGVKAAGVTARLEFTMDGAVAIEGKPVEKISPDGPLSFDIGGKGEIEGTARGIGEADIIVTKVSAAIGAKTGIKIEGGFRLIESGEFKFHAKGDWSGLDAFFETTTPRNPEKPRLYHLIDGTKLFDEVVA